MSRAELIAGLLLVALPFVAWQGPAHTTALDALNVVFLLVYWGYSLRRQERVRFPLAIPFWLILLGSFGGLWAATARTRAMLTIGQDVYLYLWCVTMAHFVARHCRIAPVVSTWAFVACAIAVLSYLDRQTGALGGHFSGELRASGTFLNPNMFGNYLVVSFFLAWSVATAERRLVYVALPLLFLGLLATASNGALAGFLAGFAVTVLVQPGKRPLLTVGALLVLGSFVVLAAGVLQSERVQQQLAALVPKGRSEIGGTAVGSAEERWPIWLDAAVSFRAHPMGVGPDNFNKNGGPISGTHYGPHNDYVGMTVERGPLGLLGWIGILAGTTGLLSGLRAAGTPLRVEALYGLMASISMHCMVIELFHFRHFWFAIALILAAAMQAQASSTVGVRYLEAA
jgi:O-antigen ligase